MKVHPISHFIQKVKDTWTIFMEVLPSKKQIYSALIIHDKVVILALATTFGLAVVLLLLDFHYKRITRNKNEIDENGPSGEIDGKTNANENSTLSQKDKGTKIFNKDDDGYLAVPVEYRCRHRRPSRPFSVHASHNSHD